MDYYIVEAVSTNETDWCKVLIIATGIALTVTLIYFLSKYAKSMICGTKDTFASTNPLSVAKNSKRRTVNPLYAEDIEYTQPMGDTEAMKYAGTGQGTLGSFLPLQGRAAGVFMNNSTQDNQAAPSPFPGTIGDYPNYTGQKLTSQSLVGYNPFPNNTPESNSYLIQGSNERVCNPGQKCPNLPAPKWWPTVTKRADGYAVQDSDALVGCVSGDISTCPGGKRFLASKYEPRWKSVISDQ